MAWRSRCSLTGWTCYTCSGTSDSRLYHASATSIVVELFKKRETDDRLMGATIVGDLGPRVSSALGSGLTADCTSLEIGDHEETRTGKSYENLLYQIRPAFGGNIIAWIINPIAVRRWLRCAEV